MNLFKYVLVIVASLAFILFVVSCGSITDDQTKVIPGPIGATGAQGNAGVNGTNGTNGVNGLNSLITTMPALSSECPTGGTVILTGLDTNGDNVLSGNEVTNSAVVCNGAVGATGSQGVQGESGPATPFTIVSIIQPCGASSSAFKEILLCLNDGNILASFSDNSNGNETRFAFIPTGTFEDTDDSGCVFTVQVDSLNNSMVSWKNGGAICAAH